MILLVIFLKTFFIGIKNEETGGVMKRSTELTNLMKTLGRSCSMARIFFFFLSDKVMKLSAWKKIMALRTQNDTL